MGVQKSTHTHSSSSSSSTVSATLSSKIYTGKVSLNLTCCTALPTPPPPLSSTPNPPPHTHTHTHSSRTCVVAFLALLCHGDGVTHLVAGSQAAGKVLQLRTGGGGGDNGGGGQGVECEETRGGVGRCPDREGRWNLSAPCVHVSPPPPLSPAPPYAEVKHQLLHSLEVCVDSLKPTATHTQAGTETDRDTQADRQMGRRAGGRAGRQADRHTHRHNQIRCGTPRSCCYLVVPRWAMPLLLWRTCSHVTYTPKTWTQTYMKAAMKDVHERLP